MEERLALISIIVYGGESVEELNDILHKNGKFIKGRMGLPQIEDGISVITVVIKATQPQISAISGDLGRLKDIRSQVSYLKK